MGRGWTVRFGGGGARLPRRARRDQSTADSVLLSLGSTLAADLLGRAHRDAAATRLGKRIAAVVMVAMAGLALVARDVTLWGLIELKMELLIQCVPVFLLALHWRGLRAAVAHRG